MSRVSVAELSASLEQLQAQMAEMSRQIELLEKGSAPAPPEAITEEELLAISAAIGAYLGVRAHIRQIRLVGTSAWAQQGRVSIQASHRLQG